MKREEEIKEAGIDYTMSVIPMCIDGLAHEKEIREIIRNRSFEMGAKWADKTFLERACKWLLNVDYDSLRYRDFCEGFNEEMFVDDFRKAMEGGVE